MVSTKPKKTWKTIILPVLGILAFLIYLYFFNVDIPVIVDTIQRINVYIYFLAILLIFVEAFFYMLSWRSLLAYLSVRLSIVEAYLYVWYGTYMEIVIPTASLSGEVSKLYLVTRAKSGVGGKVIATLVTQRLIGTGMIISSLIIGIGTLSTEGVRGLPFKLAFFFAVATILCLVLFIILCFKETWMLRITNAMVRFVDYVSGRRWNLTKMKEDTVRALREFHDSMKELRQAPQTLFLSILLVSLSWLSGLSIAYLVLLALDFPVQWGMIITACSISTVVPMRGLPEIAMTTIYALFGVPTEIGATATILTRIVTFWLKFFIGFAAQQWLEMRNIGASMNTIEEAETKNMFVF